MQSERAPVCAVRTSLPAEHVPIYAPSDKKHNPLKRVVLVLTHTNPLDALSCSC